MGYIFSPDYGVTWTAAEIAISPPGGHLPYGIVADDNLGAHHGGARRLRPAPCATRFPLYTTRKPNGCFGLGLPRNIEAFRGGDRSVGRPFGCDHSAHRDDGFGETVLMGLRARDRRKPQVVIYFQDLGRGTLGLLLSH